MEEKKGSLTPEQIKAAMEFRATAQREGIKVSPDTLGEIADTFRQQNEEDTKQKGE
jgi:hypothetical protein